MTLGLIISCVFELHIFFFFTRFELHILLHELLTASCLENFILNQTNDLKYSIIFLQG